MTFILLFIIGIGAGILAGLFGIGGGLIFTPVLFYIFAGSGMNQVTQWAIGSSLFCTFVASSSSVYKQLRNRNIFLPESLKVGGLGIIGTLTGMMITLSDWYGVEQFAVLFSLLLMYSSWNLFRRSNSSADQPAEKSAAQEITWVSALLIGLCGGIIASLAGVGGGLVMVPIMTLLIGLPFAHAVSVSSGAIVIISASAWVRMALATPVDEGMSSFTLGFIDFGTALPLIIGSLIGGYIGVNIGHRIKTRLLERLFALLLIVVAARLLYDAFF